MKGMIRLGMDPRGEYEITYVEVNDEVKFDKERED